MGNLPLVSIITPSYNQGKFIRNTIESVLSQEYPFIEYIIVDGGSTDNTLEIIKEYGDRIKWVSEKDNGQSDAINKGFKMSKGEIVAWLNSDDTYEPGAIKAAVQFFMSHQNIALVYGEGDIIDENGNKVKRFDATQEFDLWKLIHVWDYIMQPTTFFRKEAVEEVGYLDEDLNWCMDWDLWIRLSIKYDVKYLPRTLANSREYSDTKTSMGGTKRFRELVRLMRKYGSMKYPPGYFLYGASTIFTLTENIPIINLFIKYCMFIVHNSTFKRLPEIYKDKWCGEKICVSIPKNKKELIISINVLFDKNLPLSVKTYQNKRKIMECVINEMGVIPIIINLRKLDDKNLFNHITIYSNKYIIPNKVDKTNKDKRKLSFLIESVKFS